MRESIKRAATELLIRHGYRGASIAKIARIVRSTTTNIYYHFGTKERLVEEVVEDYVDDALARQRAIWTDPERTLRDKIAGVIELNRKRHHRFNEGGEGGNAWSLIGRLRLETDVVSARGRESLNRFGRELYDYITVAIRQSMERGEILARTPVRDAAFLLSNIVNSSSVFSQEAGSFETLEEFYNSFSRFFFDAYGADRRGGDSVSSNSSTMSEP